MHTLFGKMITVGNNKTVPALRDIATTLSRVPRWNGMTIVPWNVLQHSMVVSVQAKNLKYSKDVELHAALHDIEECLTGDIANPVRTHEQSDRGVGLRKWLYQQSLKLPYPDAAILDQIHVVDKMVGWGELNSLCHPRAREPFRDRIAEAGENMNMIADLIWDLVRTTEREQILMFCTLVETLMDTPAIKSAARLRA